MAYQSTSTHHVSDLPHRIIEGARAVFSVIGHAMVSAAAANRRMAIVEKLQAKSDAELAEMGLRREDIVRHVFMDMADV